MNSQLDHAAHTASAKKKSSKNWVDASAGGQDDNCGCTEFGTSRRKFLGTLGAVAGASLVLPNTGSAFVKAAFASTATAPNVLVVISLRGGSDGLSLVVPHGDPLYYTARPTISIPAASLLVPDAMFGLHPKFAPVLPMWTAGKMAAVHSVGLPMPNRSHFGAMEEIEDADPGSEARTGWLNRLVGLDSDSSPVQGMQMGDAMIPTSLYGPEPVLAIRDLNDMYLPGRSSPESYQRRVDSLHELWGEVPGWLGQGARSAVDMSKMFEQVLEQEDQPENGAVYPGSELGRALRESARLVRADIGAQVITIDSGMWDMHVGLGTMSYGPLQANVSDLARGVNAFFTDLGLIGDNVTVITITEFGRRVTENASKGLDHGYGNAMLLFGAGVVGGYHGSWRGLDPVDLVSGDLAVTRDYRSVLTEVVRTRFGADASQVFPGFLPEEVGVMR